MAEITRRLVLFQAADTSRGGYRQYREETGNTLPRLAVIVDGAEELFAHHDKLARQTRDLLARLRARWRCGRRAPPADDPPTASGTPRTTRRVGRRCGHAPGALGQRTGCGVGRGARSEPAARRQERSCSESSTAPSTRAWCGPFGSAADANHFARAPQVVDGRDVARIEDAPLDLLAAANRRPVSLRWCGCGWVSPLRSGLRSRSCCRDARAPT